MREICPSAVTMLHHLKAVKSKENVKPETDVNKSMMYRTKCIYSIKKKK